MATIEKFEDLRIWQNARDLSVLVYKVSKSLNDFRFRDQIQSAAVSIMNNIAEGFERKGNKELAKFLYIAKGSAGEVRPMSYLALDLRFLSEKDSKEIYMRTLEISKMIAGLIKVL
jgi:four helix bundle protein